MPRTCSPPACPSCSPAIITWCRPIGDIYPTKSYDKDALLQPETRARFAQLLEQGWRDAIRSLHRDAPIYTYWSYLRNRWPRDAGLRIDHLLLSKQAAKRLLAAGVDREVRGKENASDHAPVWIELRDGTTAEKPAGRARAAPRPSGRRSEIRVGFAPLSPPYTRNSPSPRPSHPIRPLLVIDGDSFAHRAYHALPKNIRRNGDRPAGAILGFANLLLRLHREEEPRAVLVGWDTYEAPTYRHEQFAAYQSGREFDDDLIEQLAIIPDLVAACGFANAKGAGYEADDFLAAAATAEERRGGRALVASGDRDTFQLASEHITILYPVRGQGMARIGPAEVRARYGVDPAQVPDFIALRGDPSDKLPGAPGVGATGAATLLRKYGSLAAILKAGRFAKQAEDLRLFRSIATMNRKAPLPRLADQRPDWGRAAALAREWQLKQLADRLDELARSRPSSSPPAPSHHGTCRLCGFDDKLIGVLDRRREIVVRGGLLDPDFDVGAGEIALAVGDVAQRDQPRAVEHRALIEHVGAVGKGDVDLGENLVAAWRHARQVDPAGDVEGRRLDDDLVHLRRIVQHEGAFGINVDFLQPRVAQRQPLRLALADGCGRTFRLSHCRPLDRIAFQCCGARTEVCTKGGLPNPNSVALPACGAVVAARPKK